LVNLASPFALRTVPLLGPFDGVKSRRSRVTTAVLFTASVRMRGRILIWSRASRRNRGGPWIRRTRPVRRGHYGGGKAAWRRLAPTTFDRSTTASLAATNRTEAPRASVH